MATEQFANNAATTLSGNGGSITSGATSLIVASASQFPGTGQFRIIIGSEIILVGAVSGTTFSSLTRGAESTVAASHNDGDAVTCILTAASIALIPGLLLNIRTITATGAGTYTPTTGTRSIVIELVGGGAGGGASVAPAASRSSVGVGGSAGGWLRKRLTANFSGASYSVGAKGSGGAAGAHDGTGGGNTTFTDTAGSPTTYTATGGTGGTQGSSGNLLPVSFPGLAGGVATTGDANQQGGASSFSTSTTNQSVGSRGGDSMYGRGGLEVSSVSAQNVTGNNATGKGAGGGGGLSTASSGGTGAAGGDGTDGLIIIWEYA